MAMGLPRGSRYRKPPINPWRAVKGNPAGLGQNGISICLQQFFRHSLTPPGMGAPSANRGLAVRANRTLFGE